MEGFSPLKINPKESGLLFVHLVREGAKVHAIKHICR